MALIESRQIDAAEAAAATTIIIQMGLACAKEFNYMQ